MYTTRVLDSDNSDVGCSTSFMSDRLTLTDLLSYGIYIVGQFSMLLNARSNKTKIN